MSACFVLFFFRCTGELGTGSQMKTWDNGSPLIVLPFFSLARGGRRGRGRGEGRIGPRGGMFHRRAINRRFRGRGESTLVGHLSRLDSRRREEGRQKFLASCVLFVFVKGSFKGRGMPGKGRGRQGVEEDFRFPSVRSAQLREGGREGDSPFSLFFLSLSSQRGGEGRRGER